MIMKAKMTHNFTQLPVKEVIFKRCIISKEVVQQAVDILKHFDHSFLMVKLFDDWIFRAPSPWVSDDEKAWHERISHEIIMLTWVNQFQVNCNHFIKELHHESASIYNKLYSYCSQGHVPFYELCALHCSDDKKLWYAAIMAAVEYDNTHNFFRIVVNLTCYILS